MTTTTRAKFVTAYNYRDFILICAKQERCVFVTIITCCCEGVSPFCQQSNEVIGEVPPGQIDPGNGMGEGVPLVDGHSVGHPIPGVHHHTRGSPRGVEREHGLYGNIERGACESLEHDLLGVG